MPFPVPFRQPLRRDSMDMEMLIFYDPQRISEVAIAARKMLRVVFDKRILAW